MAIHAGAKGETMDSVKVAYFLLFALMGLPPALGVVVPFPINTIGMSFLCIYIGSHLSLRAVHRELVDGEVCARVPVALHAHRRALS